MRKKSLKGGGGGWEWREKDKWSKEKKRDFGI